MIWYLLFLWGRVEPSAVLNFEVAMGGCSVASIPARCNLMGVAGVAARRIHVAAVTDSPKSAIVMCEKCISFFNREYDSWIIYCLCEAGLSVFLHCSAFFYMSLFCRSANEGMVALRSVISLWLAFVHYILTKRIAHISTCITIY